MKCECDKHGHLELHRKSITKRIKKTQRLKENLELIESRKDTNNLLYRCSTCDQLWQSNVAWNWQAQEYLFKVPKIEIQDWLDEQFIPPDKLIIYSYEFERYTIGQDFLERDVTCRKDDCSENAVEYSVFCIWHQFESLHKFLEGRLFEPYSLENYLEYLRN